MSAQDDSNRKAFVVRVAPGRRTQVEHCLTSNELVIGWEEARGLIGEHDWIKFRAIVSEAHYQGAPTLRQAGTAAGHLWRFIHEMSDGDLVVVPALNGRFYVAEITGPAIEVANDEVGHSRPVKWLNGGEPIDRSIAPARLQSRMKVYGSTAAASDLVGDIEGMLALAQRMRGGELAPTFESDLRERLLDATATEMREGRVDSFKFERIVQMLLQSLGGKDAAITGRRFDKGDDVVADFYAVGGLMAIRVCVQVKHYYETDRELGRQVVDELMSGMEKVAADFGIIATAGTVSDDAKQYAQMKADAGSRNTILDGKQLAELYLDHCLSRPTQ